MSGFRLCECGGEPRGRKDDHGRYSYVECPDCGRATIHCRTPEEAQQAWNHSEDYT